jgi:Na+-transporting NADH:ubiquinone oxidoreductase subunit B
MVTDSVSAVKTEKAQWLYGSFIAVMAVLIRSFSLFSSGLMFAILLGNMFGPLMDIGVRSLGKGKKA